MMENTMGLSKDSLAWKLAIGTALLAYLPNAFPKAPQWWNDLSQYKVCNFLVMWVVVYQGGGRGDVIWTTIVTAIVYFFLMFTDVLYDLSKQLYESVTGLKCEIKKDDKDD